MRAFAKTDWRRWVAMLCIALFAFVLLEDASALSDPCHTGGEAVPYNIAAATDAAGSPDAPLDKNPGAALHQHHCCGAHATGLPAGDVVALARAPVALVIPQPDQFAPAGSPSGLERPPKPSALA